ncbi:SAM-dependent methyltransferase [Aquabacterium lacunae]|uniref:SAM-dependent methyltransferase n=1 Tax=Aquabacterium lacunae TaxID=2528630 RepID=A0A4Q9GYV1_9BURK|nr:class I SAM-dependent methyltransferase [Aquabacterium lacunae]TBO27869.1 SAM-dependent methyltransferase [Aquabacterium lacunae]
MPVPLPVPLQPLLDAIAALDHVPTEACRLFHGRGGRFAGSEHWTLDAYPPVFLLTSFAPVPEDEVAQVQQALSQRWAAIAPGQPLNLVFQHRSDVRADTQVLCGHVPEPHVVEEAGARFKVHLPRGFNHGLFLDMAEGRRWVREAMAAQPGGRVLNLFAYTCAFSVAALQGGAHQVVNVDMASGALNIGKQNHQLNGLTHGASFLPHDIFSSWGKITRSGPYQLLIADPPSYQKGSFVAEKDYARLMRRLADLVVPGGHALLCLNSPKLGPGFLQDLMAEHAPGFTFVQRLGNPASFADISAERALKVMLYQRTEFFSQEPAGTREAEPAL